MKYFSRTSLIASLITAGLAMPGAVLAQSQAEACGEERDVKPTMLDEVTWEKMNEAYELVGQENYDEAMATLVKLRGRAKADYNKAIIAQGIAQVHWAQGNYDASLEEFELAVEINALPNQAHYSLMYQIAQLYYANQRYEEALDRLALWFCKVPVEEHKSTAYVLQASIYAQKEDWETALVSIDTAIAMDEDPKENWYNLKLAGHFKLEQWEKGAETLEVMITRWPDKKTYWTQLSNTYYKLEDDEKALSVMALAYRKGLLDKSQDLLYLANLYGMKDVPYKAAQVLQAGLESGVVTAEERYWTSVGDNWYAAEEYEEALQAFEKAGEISDVGKIDLRRGYILVDQERWAEAADALRAALEKGGVTERQAGEAYLMLGMSEFNQENYDAATAAWKQAGRYETARSQSRQWITHMADERERKANL